MLPPETPKQAGPPQLRNKHTPDSPWDQSDSENPIINGTDGGKSNGDIQIDPQLLRIDSEQAHRYGGAFFDSE